VFQKLGINPFENILLFIDEYHILFAQYVFREKAVRTLLEIAQNFIEKTYMTATPLSDEFMLEELKEMPIKAVI
jgi:hypothetical protein